MTIAAEARRQIVHISMGGFALLLSVLSWRQAALLAGSALLFNVLLLPRLGGRALYRPHDVARGYPAGIILYPLAVLLLILLFPRRLDLAAAAWGIMAAGDGFATLAGRAFDGRRIPWNREKTIVGSVTFVVAGAAAGIFLAWWTRETVLPLPSMLFVCVAPFVAAIVAAAAETIPVRLDDNISVPAAAATTLWIATLMSADAWTLVRSGVGLTIAPAIGLNVLVAWLGWRARAVSAAGAITGALIGIVVFVGAGGRGWALLLAAFLAATITSRVGLKRKSLLGIAEEHGGRRGPGNALANTGLAAVAAGLAILTPYRDAALLAFVTALVAGSSDTVASEIGKACGGRTFLLIGLRRVQPGTPGAVSLGGTAAGIVGAFVLAAVAVALDLTRAETLWIVVAAATIGSLIESALAARLEPAGILNNDLLNFVNTAAASASALIIAARLI